MTPARRTVIKPMTPGIPQPARLRAYLAGAVVTLGLVGVAWRAWALQVGDGDRYRALADRQHALAIDIPAPRGDVVDARGRALAVSADADSIWANPRAIRDVTETAAQLAHLIDREPAALEAKLAGDRRFVWIDRHVTPEVARAVRDAKLPGIEVAREPRRWYPGRTVGGPVIGRADIDGNGLDGIELAMNDLLQGKRGEGTAVRDARGRRMFADGLEQPEPGATVTLTLDRSIQAITDAALAQAVEVNQAKSGVAVVLDVATSHVLAMASYPTYDSNAGTASTTGARNRVVTDAYEAGSVMKVFTVAAALEAGAVRPDTEFDVRGPLQIGPKPIRDVHHDTVLTTSGIIKRSSNIGAVKIAQRLGKDRLYQALLGFGFGAQTEIELPGEQRGVVRPGERWRDIELATIAYGYGITVTPIQVAAGLAALGNRGVYRAPRIVDRVADADGTLRYEANAPPRRVVSAANAEAMRVMLGTVFERGKFNGTAHNIVVPGFRCAGKTGTAHKYDPATKKYAEDRYLSSFAGLAPLDNPRLAIVVLVDEPSGGDYFGGTVAGPVFATVASEALRYLGVPGESLVCPPPVRGADPALDAAPKTCVAPAARPSKPVPAPGLQAAPPPPVLDAQAGPSPASAQAAWLPAPFAPFFDAPTDTPPAHATITVPDFRGMGLGRAIDTARDAGIALELTGGGRVIEQDPPAGPMPAPATGVRVTLRFSDDESRSVRAVPAVP